jgi:hypothetical protein
VIYRDIFVRLSITLVSLILTVLGTGQGQNSSILAQDEEEIPIDIVIESDILTIVIPPTDINPLDGMYFVYFDETSESDETTSLESLSNNLRSSSMPPNFPEGVCLILRTSNSDGISPSECNNVGDTILVEVASNDVFWYNDFRREEINFRVGWSDLDNVEFCNVSDGACKILTTFPIIDCHLEVEQELALIDIDQTVNLTPVNITTDGPAPREIELEPFSLTRTEITVDQYRAFLDSNCSLLGASLPGLITPNTPGNHPITGIAPQLAEEFCKAQFGENATLPTNAQWEVAATWEVEEPRNRCTSNIDNECVDPEAWNQRSDILDSPMFLPVDTDSRDHPLGLQYVFGNVAEMVRTDETSESQQDTYVAKGGHVWSTSLDELVPWEELPLTGNTEFIGFRCVINHNE